MLDKSQVIAEAKAYFGSSDHWRRLLAFEAADTDPQCSHLHSYVDTSIYPYDLEKIITGYLERLGWPSARKIDHLATGPGGGSLHGIEPQGKAHFDYQWFYNPEVGLKPHEGGESGCNLLAWNRAYIEQFYSQFDFRPVGPAEEAALEEYFKSDHWLKGLEYPTQPGVCHHHINTHAGVHPDYIQKYAEASLKKEGFELYYTCPNVFMLNGSYTGKLVFMSKNPEVVFDITWLFDPKVIIEPAWEKWFRGEVPGYDFWKTDLLDQALDAEFIRLSDSEIKEILDSCVYPKI